MDWRMEYESMAAQRNTLIQQLQAAEAHLLAVRETLAATIDERNDALAEVERLRKALNLIDAARAEAVAEIAALNGTNAPSAHVHR